ncbi:PREDICTED: tetratricopeptide repeat protein 12 [Hipposideros armiger]|uniref:Tetratricopeptide repeat protein 12 n=1 Tax=Hipposideros armiger TaxID=186990 RepID=A0A8B7T512_HIPAR|nr:PREDICTED: tetratricopeptide repeat protein 12 [Hipposideros armiger]
MDEPLGTTGYTMRLLTQKQRRSNKSEVPEDEKRHWCMGFWFTMADDQEKDLQKFLKNVDEITSLIQDMNSEDPVVQEKAVLKTEKRLLFTEDNQEEDRCRTTLNKTMISPPQAPTKDADEINSEAFLAFVEKDAKERAKRRRENRVLADALKEKGNEAFVRGDYETAILCYSEGLEKLKDMKVLYTNRAQAYIKLGDYQKALVDCDWALKCDEKCTKAYFHMGKAHLALKNYSVSRECFQKILEINPQLQKQVKDYLDQVDLREKADLQEKEAHVLLDSGKDTAVTTKNLLETLAKPDHNLLFYAGGIEILTEMMKDCTERTLFRTHDGFSIIGGNEVIRRCFSTAEKGTMEETVCVCVLRLWQAVCSGNEENQRLLVMRPDMGRLLPSLLASGVLTIRQQSLALLLQLAQTENGRSLIINHLDLTRLVEALVSFLEFSDKKANSAMGLLTDLALEERFQARFQASLPGILPALTGVLQIVEEALGAGVVKKMIKFLKMGGQNASHYAIKTLAICTNTCHEARKEVIRLDKKFSVLLTLLSSEDEILVGNAALCLGNCMEVPQVATSLLKTDVVPVLLKLAGSDARQTAVQLNAGIALGKLCTAEPRFAAQLRELHGIEILNSTMKYISDP